MKNAKKMKKTKYIVLLLLTIVFYILLRTWKCYTLYDINGDSETYFENIHPENFDIPTPKIALHFGNVMYIKSNSTWFYIFSLNDFKTFKINSIKVIYDGKEKIFKYNISYNLDFENPNLHQKTPYMVGNNIIYGYKKTIIPPFMNFKYCWINFYDLFKWKHKKIGTEFDIRLIVDYSLDNEAFSQELNYKVKCEESYPVNLLQVILQH